MIVSLKGKALELCCTELWSKTCLFYSIVLFVCFFGPSFNIRFYKVKTFIKTSKPNLAFV